MTDQFPAFAKIVARDFQNIVKHPSVFVMNVDGDALFAKYLGAFPEGTNPRFNERSVNMADTKKIAVKRGSTYKASMGGNACVSLEERLHTAERFMQYPNRWPHVFFDSSKKRQ